MSDLSIVGLAIMWLAIGFCLGSIYELSRRVKKLEREMASIVAALRPGSVRY